MQIKEQNILRRFCKTGWIYLSSEKETFFAHRVTLSFLHSHFRHAANGESEFLLKKAVSKRLLILQCSAVRVTLDKVTIGQIGSQSSHKIYFHQYPAK